MSYFPKRKALLSVECLGYIRVDWKGNHKNMEKKVYAAYAKDIEMRLHSSSGGIFSLLAEKVICEEGAVYGVTLSNDCKSADFRRIDLVDDLALLRGSKYFQAKAGDTYRKIKGDLEDGLSVLFSGTGCQVNGLKRFLGKDYTNLICMDLVCHGVPSPKLWREYVDHYEAKYDANLTGVNFRCKDDNWNEFGMKLMDANRKEIYISKDKDAYMQMFLRNYCLRPSCYECKAKQEKLSDITVADFWGIEEAAPEMSDNKGVSLVICRTAKGEAIFGSLENLMVFKEVDYEDGVRNNPAEYRSVIRPAQRDTFFSDMNKMSFDELQEKYLAPSFKRRVKNLLLKTPARIFFGGGGNGK